MTTPPRASPVKGRVLVVDDDRTSLLVTQAVLEDAGYSVTIRDQALGTSALIMKEQPDIVLLDVEMPGLNGDRIVQLMQKQRHGFATKFILYTGARVDELERLVSSTGANGGIVKTGDQGAFLRDFERIIAG